MKLPRILFTVLIISSIFISCDSDDPANPAGGNNIQGDLTITISISREQTWGPVLLGGVEKSCNAYAIIKRNGEPVTDAKVVINGKESPFEGMYLKQYIVDLDYSEFVPNQKVKCSITIDGKTAEEEVVFPGDITPSSDGSSVSWKYDGNSDFIFVQEIESEETGYLNSTASYQSTDNSSDLSSPASIPASAYPKTGTSYLQTTVIRSLVYNAFSSLSPKTAIITASDFLSEKIAK